MLRYDIDTGDSLAVFAQGGGLDVPFDSLFRPDGNLHVRSTDSDEVLRYDGTTVNLIDVFASGGGLDMPTAMVFVQPHTCPWDFDGEGTIGASDLAVLLGYLGPNAGHAADLDGDGTVGSADLGPARAAEITIQRGRHSFISHAFAGGRSLAEVTAAAGHANITITATYTHVAVDDDGRIGSLFGFDNGNGDPRP